jgi:fatty-acyl-CoA synthase
LTIVDGRLLPPAAERRAALDERFPTWTPMTVSGALDAAVERYADRPLVITDEREYSYREVQQWSRDIAAGLIAQGIASGDHVAMVMANHPEFVAVKFAIARAGAVCIPINYLFRGAELGGIAPGWESEGGGVTIPKLQRVVVFSPEGATRDGAMTLAELTDAGTDATRAELSRRERTADPTAYSDILYTSGTTGRPKGVLLAHDQVVRMAYAAAYQRALEDGRRLGFPMPMYHVFGYMECLMAAMFVGGAIVPRVVFDAVDMLNSIARHRVNEVVAVPAVTLPLVAELQSGAYDCSSVHTVFSSGGAAPATIWDDIRAAFGDVELTTGYGMTETTAATTCTMPEDVHEVLTTTNGRLRYAGAAGDPALAGLIATYKATDIQTGEDLAPGELGHLLARGPTITDGYYNKPEETAPAFTPDGWLKTGDIGTIDADGNLKLAGRLKESFRVGGEMVMPKEIENVLTSHPGVADTHVCGLPHARMGEVGCAWVIVRDPDNPPERDELIAYCSARLARFKVPRHIIFTKAEELPVTATGRVQKFRLTEMAQQRLGQPATA